MLLGLVQVGLQV